MSLLAHKAPPPPCAIVIFGANGDLTKRLIVPALYNLARTHLLPRNLSLIGIDHNKKTSEDWKAALKDFLGQILAKNNEEIDETLWQQVACCMTFLSGDFEKPETYRDLKELLADLDEQRSLDGNVLFYLAVADRFFGTIAGKLGEAGLVNAGGADNHKGGFRRLIVEKPFGHDIASAKALNACLRKYLKEEQIYRIDHFLGKETVQNIMALRFANGLFEPIWNRDRIDHVQITVAESIGVETRGKFYESTGALRDMVPNHLFQLVAMTAMEPPVSFDAEDIRAKKAEMFKAIHPLTLGDVVRGQYDSGIVGDQKALAYRAEANVAPDSTVETYAAMRLMIDNWRWAGVPFYLRTGKRLNKRSTEIAIRFKKAPLALFREAPIDELDADWLILRVQPDEGIRLRFNAKRPGPAMALESVAMDFKYKDYFRQAPAVGYETLIYDCLIGDATLFQRADQVEAAWELVEPVLEGWAATTPRHFPNYASGSEGPSAANDLLARDGRSWRRIN
ncbi:MAG TPA: glucose-6-phosphate dehydrogenase [Rhizomicrobium sp.]|jgi:glucose-6-phosphate 1-dehydrogenase|nr:glucose-6-phosphate dehydrogenase [Rhizomicrobium sp.]